MKAGTRFSRAAVLVGFCCTLFNSARAEQVDAVSRAVSVLVTKKNVVESAGGPASGGWKPASLGLELVTHDRLRTGNLSQAGVRLTNLSVMQIDELTTIEILPPKTAVDRPSLDLKAGQIYFFSRDKPREIELQTPVATGALRGTEFNLSVAANGRTVLTMIDGEVELKNARGSVVVGSDEQGVVEPGGAPTKTSAIYTRNTVQWCLYYPGVIDAAGLHLADDSALAPSVRAYTEGSPLEALRLYPRGRRPANANERAYRASLLLAVGRVDEAFGLLKQNPPYHWPTYAIHKLIGAVRREQHDILFSEPHDPSDWLAESYLRQSRGDLGGALAAAREAVAEAPDFGYAWVHLAELQFGFGEVREASESLAHGRPLSPRNAQAAALAGYFASAANRIGEARAHFDEAIALDNYLGNAWLGRGLCEIRQGHPELGRRDLQTATAVESNRALLHGYLGKAFSNAGDDSTARRELTRAQTIDPSDPTSWLYLALLDRQDNRFNTAVAELENSLDLNDNRRLYRSRFLLDQDRAVRNTNLASIYQDDGLTDLSLRAASRAVNDDYGNASAHLFLSNSYNALRDPRRILLRYDTPFFDELLVASLLAPVGGGPLSQNVSEQEYSKLFERDRLGLSTNTTYLSNGDVRELASQFGQFGNFSYSVDLDFEDANGIRPNNALHRTEVYTQVKYQLGLQDSLLLETKYENNTNGDVFQLYDPDTANRSYHFAEKQEPLAFLGFHHQWNPEQQTLLLAGRLDATQSVRVDDAVPLVVERNVAGPLALNGGIGQFASAYRSDFTIYTGEATHIWQTPHNTLVAGVRYQDGVFDTSQRYDDFRPAALAFLFHDPPADQSFETGYHRFSIYGYDTVRPLRSLSVTVGLGWDSLYYPEDYRDPPLTGGQVSVARLSPRVGVIWEPWRGGILRAAWGRSLGGVTVEESARLEPILVGGFDQGQRTFIPENVLGSVDGARNERTAAGFEQKLGPGTYLSLEGSLFKSTVPRTQGVFGALVDPQFNDPRFVLPFIEAASTPERLAYSEKDLLFTANQLLGEGWSLSLRYNLSRARLQLTLADIPAAIGEQSIKTATLQQLLLFALYNHPSGFFGRAETLWSRQENRGYEPALPGDDFWQVNLLAGYRFAHGRGDVTLGLLDVNGSDYRLNPLNAYNELPRSPTLAVQLRLNL